MFGLTIMLYFEKKSISILLIVISGIVFGAIVELMQFMMPFDRSGSLYDVGLNTIGAGIAGIMLLIFKIWYVRNSERDIKSATD